MGSRGECTERVMVLEPKARCLLMCSHAFQLALLYSHATVPQAEKPVARGQSKSEPNVFGDMR